MAMQPLKRMSTHQKLPVMHQKKQERNAMLPSYFSGGLTAAILVFAVLIAATLIVKCKRTAVMRSKTHCNRCFMRPIHWLPMCCRYGYCSHCLALVMMRHHRREWADEPPSVYFCTRRGPVGVVNEMGDVLTFFEEMLPVRKGFEREPFPPWFLNDVKEISEGGETFTVLWYKNIEDCRSRKWPKRRRVVFKHVGDHAVERIGEAEDLPPLIEYSN
ncbi:hypothetical protein SETIT_9G221100v2 [Setaria italica]|uniref:Uncharacterized protein n=1 Tax=Setaria italica TaxID=4555 RepID=A0A368SJG9_SETIT|nr:hypothetical protein SETIT_9G221100v2 [Setaria italica]